jgi:hypothetical protein
MLTIVQIVNGQFFMDVCVVKASESYKKSYEFAYEVLWISTLRLGSMSDGAPNYYHIFTMKN